MGGRGGSLEVKVGVSHVLSRPSGRVEMPATDWCEGKDVEEGKLSASGHVALPTRATSKTVVCHSPNCEGSRSFSNKSEDWEMEVQTVRLHSWRVEGHVLQSFPEDQVLSWAWD